MVTYPKKAYPKKEQSKKQTQALSTLLPQNFSTMQPVISTTSNRAFQPIESRHVKYTSTPAWLVKKPTVMIAVVRHRIAQFASCTITTTLSTWRVSFSGDCSLSTSWPWFDTAAAAVCCCCSSRECRQFGHDEWDRSQVSMHLTWNPWLHFGSTLTFSPSTNSPKHIGHSVDGMPVPEP